MAHDYVFLGYERSFQFRHKCLGWQTQLSRKQMGRSSLRDEYIIQFTSTFSISKLMHLILFWFIFWLVAAHIGPSYRLSDKTICMASKFGDNGEHLHYDVHNLYGYSHAVATRKYEIFRASS